MEDPKQPSRKSPPVETLQLIVKYKSVGWDDKRIAAKMDMTEQAIAAIWQELKTFEEHQIAVDALTAQYTLMAHQYQLLGESLKLVAGALGNTMPPSDIKALIVADDRNATVKNLLTKAIVLRPYQFSDPAESLQKHLKQVQQGN